MSNIKDTIKEKNTANILLDAFGDGHEFTMHDYDELTGTINELYGGYNSDDNPCYSVSWLRNHFKQFGIEKVGSREVEIMTSHRIYEQAYHDRFKCYFNKCTGRKYEPKTVKQFIYRMDNTSICSMVIKSCNACIRREIYYVTNRIENDQKYLKELKQML